MQRSEIEWMPIASIKPYDKNPRRNDDAVDAVANSITEFGFKNPIIVDNDLVIIAGHTRLKAAKKLGLKEVPVVIASDLTPEQVRAYRLADNKTGELAEWDFDMLDSELAEIADIDMSQFGFDPSEMEDALIDSGEAVEDDFDAEPPEEPVTKRGDIYLLGDHILMCGDSTSEADVAKLMQGEKADMVFTDPPYNIAYSGVNDKRSVNNDSMDDESFVRFLEKAIPKVDTAYVCCSWQKMHLFKQAMENKGMPPKALIVWDKVNPAQHLDLYFKQHEMIWYFGKFGGEKTVRGDIWQIKRQMNTVHPTMKPIALIAMALNDNPNKRVVYDAFGGSGSTLIACEQTGRKCRMMELDPHYCDVIVRRWEEFTGRKAELVEEREHD